MSLPAERTMPIIVIIHHDAWYRVPAPGGPEWLPDELAALAAARHIWPGTAFRIVDYTEPEMRALWGDR